MKKLNILYGCLFLAGGCFAPDGDIVTASGAESTGDESPTTSLGGSTSGTATQSSSGSEQTTTDPTIDPGTGSTDPTDPTGESETESTTGSTTASTDDSSDTTGGSVTDTGETSESETSESDTSPECDPGLLDCGSGSCDVDSNSDADNCGECGHSCLGGECDGGECQPLALHVNGDMRALAVDEDQVFFVTQSTLESIPQEPTANSEVLENDTGGSSSSPTRFVAESGLFAFGAGGSNQIVGHVPRVPKVGGVAGDVWATGPETGFVSGPQSLVASANRIYWTSQAFAGIGSPTDYYLRGVSVNGGGLRTYVAAEPTSVTALEATADHVYWFQGGDVDALRRRPAGFGSATDVMTGLTSCNSITAGDEGLYFSCRDAATSLGTLFSSDFDGANSSVLLTSESEFFEDGLRLAISGDDLVWLDVEGPFLDTTSYTRTVTVDGDSPATVREGTFEAADSDAYFWRASDQIWMLAK